MLFLFRKNSGCGEVEALHPTSISTRPQQPLTTRAPCLEGLEADADIEGLGGKTWAADQI